MFYSSNIVSYATAKKAQSDAIDAKADARDAKTETELLRHDIDRLLMITEALWTLLKNEHNYSDEDLAHIVTEIDLRDGRLDGKSAKASTASCPKCGKINTAKRRLCIYCGNALPVALFSR